MKNCINKTSIVTDFSRMVKSLGVAFVISLLCCTISSCAHRAVMGKAVTQSQLAAAEAAKKASDAEAEAKRLAAATAEKNAEESTGTKYFEGTGNFVAPPAEPAPAVAPGSEDTVELNFRDTDVRAVVAAVLGDMLDYHYSVDPQVKGTITLQSSQPIKKALLFASLEEVLSLQGYAVVFKDDVYNVIPLHDASRRIQSLRKPVPASFSLPGFGVQLVSLKFISAAQMAKILEPFAPQGGILSQDISRNMLMLAGTGEELSTMLDVIRTFDVDWMKGMSFAFFEVKNADAKILADELTQVFDTPANPAAGLVRLIPIPRMNSILAISSQLPLLKDVETWVSRLDKGTHGSGRKIFVYHVENAKATVLATALNNILGSGGSQFNGGAMSTGASSGSKVGGATSSGSSTMSSQPTSPSASGGGSLESQALKIVPNEDDNSLLILATPQEYKVVESALEKLDVVPRQVLIEVSLAEVSLNDDLKYGVQWFFDRSDNSVTLSNNGSGSISSEFPGFSYVYSGISSARAVLNALDSKTNVRVLSSPKLMVLNNHTATLQIGDQVPVATQSAQSVSAANAPVLTTVQFRDTGVILNITPRVNSGGLVLLDIQQEVSDVAKTTSSGIDSPTIQQRKISTSVAVQDGETIALGGLIKENENRGKSGIPILQDIPLLGMAFRTSNNTVRRTELIILITPRVVNDLKGARATMEYLRGQFKRVDKVLRNGVK
jgi:general secretion pathway protein D